MIGLGTWKARTVSFLFSSETNLTTAMAMLEKAEIMFWAVPLVAPFTASQSLLGSSDREDCDDEILHNVKEVWMTLAGVEEGK